MLAFAPSSLMLAVTTFVSTDIAAVPLLWIVPLALYLLTFVMAFSSPQRYPAGTRGPRPAAAVVAAGLHDDPAGDRPVRWSSPVHLLVFFLAALLCHRALADDRPSAGAPDRVLLWVAVGGVLGSLFNTLAAPVLFTGIVEYPLVLVLVCLLRTVPVGATGRESRAPESRPGCGSRGLDAGDHAVGVPQLDSNTMGSRFGVPAFLCLRSRGTTLPLRSPSASYFLLRLFNAIEAARSSTPSEPSSGRTRQDPPGRSVPLSVPRHDATRNAERGRQSDGENR